MDNLYSQDEKMISKDIAEKAFSIVFQLLLSSVENMREFQEPNIGDWCVELTATNRKTPDLIGVVKEVTGDGYIIQTVLGQTVTWTNCRMIKLPDVLLEKNLHTELLQLLKSNGVDIGYI